MRVQFAVSELVSTIELDPIPLADPGAEALKFRIEILKRRDTGRFFGRVYRRESFRLQPSFPQDAGKLPTYQGDHELHVLDDALAAHRFEGQSADEVLKKVQETIRNLLG